MLENTICQLMVLATMYSSGLKKVTVLLHTMHFPFHFICVSISLWRVGVLLKRKTRGHNYKGIEMVAATW